MDILSYINRMNQIYGSGQQAAPVYNTQKYLQGGRVGYQEAGVVARKSPIKINEETFKKIDNFIAKSEGTLSKKALGESLGYKIVEKGKTAGQGGLNKVIKAC